MTAKHKVKELEEPLPGVSPRTPSGDIVLYASVPSLVGMTLAEAKDVLKKADLSLTTWHRRISTGPLCTVLDQEPGAGTKVSEGRSVRLWVAVSENDPSVRC